MEYLFVVLCSNGVGLLNRYVSAEHKRKQLATMNLNHVVQNKLRQVMGSDEDVNRMPITPISCDWLMNDQMAFTFGMSGLFLTVYSIYVYAVYHVCMYSHVLIVQMTMED